MTLLTKAKSFFTGKTAKPGESKGTPIGGFMPGNKGTHYSKLSMLARMESLIDDIKSDKAMPRFEAVNAVAAIQLLKSGVNEKGELDENLLSTEDVRSIERHLTVLTTAKPKTSGSQVKPGGPIKPLVTPPTRPAAAKASTPAPAPKPPIKRKPTLDEIKNAIYLAPAIPIAARKYAVAAAEIKHRNTDGNGVFDEATLNGADAYMFRRSQRLQNEITQQFKNK